MSENKQRELINRMQSILDGAQNGVLTPEQAKMFDKLDAEFDKLQKNASVPKRRTSPDPLTPSPTGTVSYPSQRRGYTYSQLFDVDRSNNGGFQSLEEYFEVVASGRYDERLKALAHSEGTPSRGGFIVPEPLAAELLDPALEQSIVIPRADVRPMTSEKLKIGSFTSEDHSGESLYGGFTANWVGESDSIDEETGKLRQVILEAKKLALFTKSSNELLEDGQNFDDQLSRVLTQAAAWHLDRAFLRGTGSGEPKGVLNDPALITVSAEEGQAASTILYENLTKMLARLHVASFLNSVWVCNPTCVPQLLQLSLVIGTGGAAVPVMRETDGGFQILTRPVLFSEKLPALGSKGDIILADFSQYIVGLRRDFRIDRSAHVGFQTDEMAWRGILRADGQGSWENVFTPNSGDTQSWCVALAART